MIVQTGLGVQRERAGIEMRMCLSPLVTTFCWGFGGGDAYFALAI